MAWGLAMTMGENGMEDSFQGGYRCQAPMETEEVDLGRDVTLLMLAMVNLR